MTNYDAFTGTFPYASELFGVYQPLLGWRSKQTLLRVEAGIVAAAKGLIASMLSDPRGLYTKAPRPVIPDWVDPLPEGWMQARISQQVQKKVETIRVAHGREPTRDEWNQLLTKEGLDRLMDELHSAPAAAEAVRMGGRADPRLSSAEMGARPSIPIAGTNVMARGVRIGDRTASELQESVTAGALEWLNEHAPELVPRLFAQKARAWEARSKSVDPLALFDTDIQQAVLSPIGIVHLYREYFFEFDTFLGSPVGHVWISPGGTVDLVEVNTRRTLTERAVEALTETTSRSEITTTEHDEISDAIKEENQRNIKFGMSASWGSNWVVAHAEASTNFGLESSTKQAAETTHKHMREQSEKVSSEIRRNFKTTFRSVTEVTDTSSRHYTVENKTERLVNYELRRKMRKVGVQVQQLGTQLCWQAYVDEPGRGLGIAELVSLGHPDELDSIQPPDKPVEPEPETLDFTAPFAYEVAPKPDGTLSHRDIHDDFKWEQVGGQMYFKSDDAYIVPSRDYRVAPPQSGYNLVNVSIASHSPPNLLAAADPEVLDGRQGTFRITLKNVNFDGNPVIQFSLRLVWEPDVTVTDKAKAEYLANYKEYLEARSRKAREEYVKSIRERITAASNVALRPSSELREEERTVIYRRLIRQLMPAADQDSPHIASELIRSLFDVDKMLYFVAPEWWMPREVSGQQIAYTATGDANGKIALTAQDKIGWGGIEAKGRNNYLISDESQAARLGSSLGWLLQLDGDNHRNAFLNSPWVKAVIPIRPGREQAALKWLEGSEIEGKEGLDARYLGPVNPRYVLQGWNPDDLTIRQALDALAREIADNNASMKNALNTEKVFEKGFDPLEGGFRATGRGEDAVFDQWIEVLPTDQVVAIEYPPNAGP